MRYIALFVKRLENDFTDFLAKTHAIYGMGLSLVDYRRGQKSGVRKQLFFSIP